MYEDDRNRPDTDMATPHGEAEPREHDWSRHGNMVAVTLAELRQALAVLAVLEMDEDLQDAGGALWVH